jgi:predicted NBD/HSP70 family sugar kinase
LGHNDAMRQVTSPSLGEGTVGSQRADQATVRRSNLALVLRLLRDHGPRSRSAIAQWTGLNRATISSLVGELIARGLVRVGGAERTGSVGRPSQPVELHGRAVAGIGLEINVDYLSVIVLDLMSETVLERQLPLDVPSLEHDEVLDQLVDLTRLAISAIEGRSGQTVGLTVAVPGLVDVEAGVVAMAPNLDWHGMKLQEKLIERLNHPAFPVVVENDANLCALGELVQGEVGVDDIAYLTGAVGVGLGVIAGGRLMRGADGFSGEVGHMPINPEPRVCGCGRTGCWETMVGFDALLREVADEGDPVHDRSRDLEDRLTEVSSRAAAGDARTLAALEQVGVALGLGTSIIVNFCNPRAIVLGGYFAALASYLLEPMNEELARRVVAPRSAIDRVVPSKLGFTAAVRGGAQRSLDNVMEDPTMVPVQDDSVVQAARPNPSQRHLPA